MRQATATFSRRRGAGSVVEGAPYKANDLIANRYTVKDVVAAGPLGFVFRVHDKEIDVEVALKVINPKLLQTPEERRTFSKHLKLARKLSHPNLVRVYEDGEDNDRPFFTSQFLDGLSLRKIIDLRLQKGQFFALHEIEPILAQVCQALEGAHKVGPHSDLKPDNVLVLPDLLKVTDFGLGLAVPRLPFVQAMKARKADRYLAPELAEGREVDERIDLYSLGVILGEMLSGLTPDGSVPELARRNPDVSQPLEGFYRKAINQNPLARHKSAADFLGELSDLSKKGASATAKPKVESGASPAPAPARPRPTAGSLQLQPRRETKPPPPVPDLPPPPPPQSEENPLPDETQRVDSLQLEEVLARSTNGSSNGHRDPLPMGPPSVEVADPIRDSTEVVDSGQFVAGADDNAETKASVDAVPGDSIQDASPVGRSRTWLLVAALIVVGVTMGAALGYFLVQRQKAGGPDDRNPPVAKVDDKAALDKGAANVEEVEGVNVRPTPRDSEEVPVEKVAALKAEADKAASERAAADKAEADKAEADKAAAAEKAAADKEAADRAAADKAAAEKAVADKAAAEKAAADKAVADRAAADKAAERAAEKAAADKAAQEKLAADRAAAAKAAQEKAAAAKAAQDKAAQERAAKLAADKAAADKAAADKAAADKVAADKAAADKAAQDKAAKEKVATADKGATQDSAAAAGKPLPAAPGEPCPAGMRLVAKGEFKMGTARNDPMMGFDEKALVSVEVKGFCIDAFEYPNKKGTAPSVSISWADAKRSCEGQGKRLCSEAEWEKSCKGPGGARWPFGNGWDVAACNTEDESGEARAIVPAGRFAKCRSGYGVADLSGNVAEWTEDKVVKGGSFASADYAVRCSARRAGAQMSKSSEVGFRCCSDPP